MALFEWLPAWQQSDVEIKNSDVVYSGFFKVDKLHLRHRQFSGEWSPWLVREQIHRCDAAAVLLWDPKQDVVVMIEQFRVGLIGVASKQSPWILEIVAGLLEDNEEPKNTVYREAVEEAGCEIEELLAIGEFYNTPGAFAEKTYLYAGIVDATNKGGHHGLPDEHEDIKVHVLPIPQVLAALQSGELRTSASTVISLNWLKEKRRQMQSEKRV